MPAPGPLRLDRETRCRQPPVAPSCPARRAGPCSPSNAATQLRRDESSAVGVRPPDAVPVFLVVLLHPNHRLLLVGLFLVDVDGGGGGLAGPGPEPGVYSHQGRGRSPGEPIEKLEGVQQRELSCERQRRATRSCERSRC